MAGFKYKKVAFTVGSADFPADTGSANVLIKEQSIVKGIAQAIIDCNVGWELDSRHSSITDFKEIPDYNYNSTNGGMRPTALFLTNTAGSNPSGCKLFIGYVAGTRGKGLDVDNSMLCKVYNPSSPNNVCVSGLLLSIIPSGSNSVFGTTAADLIPSDATRVTGTILFSYENFSSNYAFANQSLANGDTYEYGVMVTPYVIGIVFKAASDNVYARCFCGRILGDLIHPTEDTGNYAKYGTITFNINGVTSNTPNEISVKTNNANNFKLWNVSSSTNDSYFGGIDDNFSNQRTVTNGEYMCGGNSVCDVNGNWISNTANTGVLLVAFEYMAFSDMFTSFSGTSRRWTPYVVSVISNDIDTYGVVPGDGFKAYLDTDLFRCMNAVHSQLYDNGNFIGVNYGLALGWDPSNESW